MDQPATGGAELSTNLDSTVSTLWWDGALEAGVQAIERARSGEPATLVLVGEPGVGKSTLLDELVRRAEGFRVLSTEAFDDEVDPYASLAGWGISIDATAPQASSPFLAAQEIRSILDDLGADQAVLLRLDDLHWADPESVRALVALMRRLSGDRVLLAVASRPLGDLHPEWQHWTERTAGVVRVELQGLSLTEATELAARLRPTLDVLTVKALWEHTAGNPLYLRALLAEFDPATLARSRLLPAPAQYVRLIGQRLSRLGEPSVRLLQAAVVLGAGWVMLADAAEVAAVADIDAAVDDLTGSGLMVVRDLGGGLDVRASHAMIRSAVYQQIPLSQRRALHASAARVVGLPDAVLEHRAAATSGFDDALAAELTDLGWARYEELRYREAAHMLRLSSTLLPDVRSRESRWLDSLYVSVLAGDFLAVEEEVPRVRAASDAARGALVLGALAIFQGRYSLGIEILSSVPEPQGGPALAGAGEAALHYRREVLLSWTRVNGTAPDEVVRSSIERCNGLGVADRPMMSMLRYVIVVLQVRTQHGTEQMLADLPPLPEDPAAVPDEMAVLVGVRAYLKAGLGHYRAALRDYQVTLARATAGRDSELFPGSYHAVLGYLYWMTGQWDLARLNYGLAVRISEGRLLPMIVAVLIIDHAGRGDFAETDRRLDQLEAEQIENPWPEAIRAALQVRVVRLHADPGSAVVRAELLPLYRSRWPDIIAGEDHRPWMVSLVVAAIWAGEFDQADTWADMVDGGVEPAPWAHAVAAWLRALVAEGRGNAAEALDRVRRACAGDASETPFYQAHILSDRARLETRDGDPEAAARAADSARGIYRRLGAVTYLNQPHLQIDRHDRDREPEATPPAELPPVSMQAVGDRFGLSDRERDVLMLLTNGLSMKQIAQELFITASTVSFHLGRIYAKTGVHSRHKLTGLLREQAMAS